MRVRIVGIATFGTADGFGPSTFTGLTLHAARTDLAGSSAGQVTQVLVSAAPGVSPERLAQRLKGVFDGFGFARAATRDVGARLIIANSVSVALYLSLTAISIFKPWRRTARGRRPSSLGGQ